MSWRQTIAIWSRWTSTDRGRWPSSTAISSLRLPAIRAASSLSYSLRPRAIVRPSGVMISTTSPRANTPSTLATPAGNRLLPLPSARSAPASTMIRPRTFNRPASQPLRARFAGAARKIDPLPPLVQCDRGASTLPEMMARWAPAPVAILAASIFEVIPPDPMPDAEPPSAMAAIRASMRSIVSISIASASTCGLAV